MNKTLKSFQAHYHKLVPENARLYLYNKTPKFLRQPWDKAGKQVNFSLKATEADIFYCFRLFLKREPTEDELQYWRIRITQLRFDIDRLVQHFLYNAEFIKLQEDQNQPYCIDLENFKLFARKNDYATGVSLIENKIHEPAVTEQVQKYLSPGDTFIDIGANIGYFSMLAASIVGDEGQVFAFEPLSNNCDLIQLSISANEFKNITLYPYAVGETEDVLKLMAEGNYSNAHLQTVRDLSGNQQNASGDKIVTADGFLSHLIDVRVVALDNFLTNLNRVDMVKIDIEGVEPLAWRGMEKIISTFKPIVLTEFFPDYIQERCQIEPELFLDMIIEQGYVIHVLEDFIEDINIPKSKTEILQFHHQKGMTHLDLMAVPQK